MLCVLLVGPPLALVPPMLAALLSSCRVLVREAHRALCQFVAVHLQHVHLDEYQWALALAVLLVPVVTSLFHLARPLAVTREMSFLHQEMRIMAPEAS